ncbi:MAG TPA: CRISPR-associated endonuclease Cas2 [Candidatus Absconditabacterales bacterium]|nr:CRISPR-associated endonuclease Cas2 [Candidatus Absconditabacterales bacterium]HNG96809.1 CRISPR-associated endonuclease Cas2 [Candidatus Absconditabacterales bacterium]
MIILSYDITNDRVRTKFAQFLNKYGRRLQYSVRELKYSERMLDVILVEIEKKWKKSFENTDSILILKICEGCNKKIIRYGYAVQEEQEIVFL